MKYIASDNAKNPAGEGAYSAANIRNASFQLAHGGGNYESTYTSQHNEKQKDKESTLNKEHIKLMKNSHF